MKRLIIGTLVLAAIAAPLATMNASAAGAKLGKPGKIDPKTMTVEGGLPYPLGLAGAPDHGFGHVRVSFPTPVDTGNHVDTFTVTCTPVIKFVPTLANPVPPTDLPAAPISAAFGPMTATYATNAALTAQGYSKDNTGIHLTMPKYEDPATSGAGAQTPPLACAVTASNNPALHPGLFPGGGGGSVAGKAPKFPTSPATDCAVVGNAGYGGFPDVPVIVPPTFEPGTTTLHLNVVIDAGGGTVFDFCSTDASYRAKFLTEQATAISAATKVKFKAAKLNKDGTEAAPAVRSAFVKKLGLVSPVNSSIPLTVAGSQIVYRFDPAKLKVAGGSAGCVMKAAKTAGKVNACVVNNITGTITLNSSDITLIKVGKPITSATTDIEFTYVNNAAQPDTSSIISLESAKTNITVGTTPVNVNLAPAGILFAIPSDPNIGAAAVTLVGLL